MPTPSPTKDIAWLARLQTACVNHLQKRPALLFLELFVALSLSVNFFHLVKTQCLPKKGTGNVLSARTFCWLSPIINLSARDLPPAWRTRIAAPALSSWMETRFDTPIDAQSAQFKNLLDVCQTEDFQNLFGFYHAGWLFLVFLLLIGFRQDALLLILAVFAGLMYNLIGPAWGYYYPWDMPAMFFFTLACLLFHRQWIWPLLPVVWLGGLFKETTLCCALFILLGGHWNWKKRVVGFLAVIAATLATNRLLMAWYHVESPMLVMNNARNLADLFHNTLLFQNIRILFSLDLNQVAFANAGALLLMLFIPWRNRRDALFKLVIGVFALGQFLYGYINEFRVWYELLPLGWILISEMLSRRESTVSEGTDWSKKSYGLVMGTLLALALATWGVAQYESPGTPADTRSEEEILQAKIALAESGDVKAQIDLGQTYRRNQNYDEAIRWYRRAAETGDVVAQGELGAILFGIRHDVAAAEEWLRRAAEQGHPSAQYCLGMIYWDGLQGRQDYHEGSKWLLEAARNGEANAQLELGKIYFQPPPNVMKPNLVAAYEWLKMAQINGANRAGLPLKECAAAMTAEEIATAEKAVKQVIEGSRRQATASGSPTP